jgi:predicted MFS family arabinose efflux permease
MLWLNFSPLISFLMETYSITEDTASLMMLIFPVMYVLFSIHAGALTDKIGYKKVMRAGAFIMLLGAGIRIFHENFWILFAGQAIIALSQPYIINGISKLVADWFPEDQVSTATGIGTAGMFIGMAIGAAVTPMLMGENNSGYQTMLIIMAAITLLTVVFFTATVSENNKATGVVSTGSLRDFVQLLKNKNILIINIISFLSLGFFNGLTGWIEPILAEQGISKEDAGGVAGLLIFGGIIGAGIVPAISDKVKKRKPFIILSAVVATALSYPLMTGSDMVMLLVLGGLLGILFLPGYPLLIASSEEEAGKDRAGAATGLLMLSGNLGGIITIVAMQMLKGDGASWSPAIYFCIGLLVVAIVMALMMKETFRR